MVVRSGTDTRMKHITEEIQIRNKSVRAYDKSSSTRNENTLHVFCVSCNLIRRLWIYTIIVWVHFYVIFVPHMVVNLSSTIMNNFKAELMG